MSTSENRELVERLMSGRARGDHGAFRAAMAEDFVWRIIGSTAWSREYRGVDDIRERLLEPLYGQFTAPTKIRTERMIAEGEYVVVQARGEATTKRGEAYNNSYCFVMRLAGGKLVEMTEYMDTALVERVLKYPSSGS